MSKGNWIVRSLLATGLLCAAASVAAVGCSDDTDTVNPPAVDAGGDAPVTPEAGIANETGTDAGTDAETGTPDATPDTGATKEAGPDATPDTGAGEAAADAHADAADATAD